MGRFYLTVWEILKPGFDFFHREEAWRYSVRTWERTQGQSHEQMLTDLDVGLFVCWHLSEAERRDVAPQGEGLGDPSTRVAGVYQVCREGEQPARRQPHGPVKTGLCRNLIRTAHHIDVRSVLLVQVKELINDLESKTNSWCVRLCKPQNSRN